MSAALVRVGEAFGAPRRGIVLFAESHQLPHGHVAIARSQGVQGDLRAVVPQQGLVLCHLGP